MPSPTVAASAPYRFPSGTGTASGAAPAGTVNGSVLTAIATLETNVAGWTAAGWELFGTTGGSAGTLAGNSKRVYVWRRLADGVDDSININRSPGASSVAVLVRRYAGTFSGTLAQILEAIIESQFQTPDPAQITPSWGSADFTVDAIAAGLPSTPGYPSGYTDAQATAGELGVSDFVMAAAKAVTGATENPPTFPGSLSHGFAITIAVRGTAPAATLTGDITTDDAAPTGTLGAAPGTITTQPWKNDAGDPQPLLTVPLMTFLRRSDGVQVLTLANQVTSSSPTAPVIAVTNAALVPGVFYMLASWTADGSLYGIEQYQAA